MGDPYTTTYYTIQSWPASTEDNPWPDASINIAENLLSDLKRANEATITNAIQVFSIDSSNGPIRNMNMETVKQNNAFRASQNDTNKASFLNRYLYLILKIIFFILLFVVLYYKLRDNFANVSTNIGSQMTTIQEKASNVVQKFTPK